MARRSKGHRRGSRPWKPGVRSLTSAAPTRKPRPPKVEARACESCCQPFEPAAQFPDVPLCRACHQGERRYQRSLLPPKTRVPKGDPAEKNKSWLTPAEYRMVKEAVARRAR